MALDITLTKSDDLNLALEDAELEVVLNAVLDEFELDGTYQVSVSVVSDEEICALNSEWRGIERPTDVLSFECDDPFDEDIFEGEPCIIGDIVLAPDYIAHQAQEFNTTSADETRLLCIHGCLHLLGFDHEEEEEYQEMITLEQKILNSLQTDGTITEHVLVKHHEEV